MLNKKDIDSLIFDVEALNLNLLVANPLTQRGWELAIKQVTSLLKSKVKEEKIAVGDTVKVCSALEGAPDELCNVIRGKNGKLILDDVMGTDLMEVDISAIQKIPPEDKEECEVCHGAGSTTDHHDPCTECGGSGYYD